jgi:hypothetical protein
MIVLFEKYKIESKFKVGDIIIVDYYGDNELGIYSVHRIRIADNMPAFYVLFDIINNQKLDGWFLESDLRLAKQSEIDKAEILKNSKKYNI